MLKWVLTVDMVKKISRTSKSIAMVFEEEPRATDVSIFT